MEAKSVAGARCWRGGLRWEFEWIGVGEGGVAVPKWLERLDGS